MDPFKFRSNWVEFLVVAASFILYFQIIHAANNKVCQSEACKNIATSILQKMNRSVNPCDNFYEFVCGNFSRNAVIPHSWLRNDLIIQLEDIVFKQLKNEIENHITKNDPKAFQKLFTFYKTCMDEDQIEKTSINEFLRILKELGDWPVLLGKSYDDSKFDWTHTIHNISRMGYSHNYFFSMYISPDLKNTTRNILYLDVPDLNKYEEYLSEGLKSDFVEAYFKYMVDMAVIFGGDREQAKLDLGESLKFEIKLAKISLSTAKSQSEEKIYNPMKISEVQSKYPYISWLQYLNDQLSPFYRLTEDEVVIVSAPSFFENLGNLLVRTPKRVLANYAFWRVAYESSSKLNQKVQDAYNEFIMSLMGKNNKITRWEICIDSARYYLSVATSSLYVRKNVDKTSKDDAINIANHLRQSVKNIVLKLDWINETARRAALQKLDQMLLFVQYFDELLDDEKINEFYKDFKLYPRSYLKTILSYNQFVNIKALKRYGYPNPRFDWTNYASDVVNAFYNPNINSINIPAAILQGDFYNKGYPKYVKYASIGTVIGHVIIDAYNNENFDLNSNGDMVHSWKAETEKEYLRRAKCIVDQYSSYIDPQVGLNLNGNLTRAQNIDDNGGVKAAYLAYAAFEEKNGVEPTLPNFEDFTARQLFWISYGNIHCTKYQMKDLRDLITNDSHSPERFRVIGMVTNSPHFSEDFNCPVDSPMNPKKKCSFW